MRASPHQALQLLDYCNRNGVTSSHDVQATSLAARTKSRRKNGGDLRLDHLRRGRIAAAISRFHGERYTLRPIDSIVLWIFAFDRHAGFRFWHALSPEWTSQRRGLCIHHIDRSAIRRADHGRAVVFWRVAWSARALVCVRRFRKLALDFIDVAR